MNPMDHNNPMLNRNLSLPALLTYLFISLVSHVDASEFFQRNGLAIEGYDPVAYFEEHKPVAGSAQYTTLYQGSRFQFASTANRDLFTAKPEKYAPQYGGFCAFGMAMGYKASIDPIAFNVVGGKLYLTIVKRSVPSGYRIFPAIYERRMGTGRKSSGKPRYINNLS